MNPLLAAGIGVLFLIVAVVLFVNDQKVWAGVAFAGSVLCDIWFVQSLRAQRRTSAVSGIPRET